MSQMFTRILLALGLVLTVALVAPGAEAQVNPTQQSVNEDALFEALGTGDYVAGRATIPDPNAGFLIKPENKVWAALQGDLLHSLSIWLVLGMLAVLTLFFLIRGRIRIDSGKSGRKIQRFNAVERFAHWTLATTFIILALTGLNIIIGKTVILRSWAKPPSARCRPGARSRTTSSPGRSWPRSCSSCCCGSCTTSRTGSMRNGWRRAAGS
jgi:formate dehydrogenase subunit gamma